MTLEEALRLLAAKDAELDALRCELASVTKRLDAMLELAAAQNQQLSELTDMMRRRLQRAPKKNAPAGSEPAADGEPDPDPPPAGAPGGGAAAELDLQPRPATRRGRKKGQGRRSSGRNELPAHLDVDVETHCPDNCQHCGGHELLARDEEVSEKLTFIKGHFRVRRIVRKVVRCGTCNRTTTATMPPMPKERATYDCAFLAWLVYQKFVMLVPLDRIGRSLASQGLPISMGTLVHLINRAVELLGAIDGEHWKQLKAGGWMALDGTGLKTVVDWMPTTWLGNLDIFVRDELTVYQFSMTKHGKDLAEKLKGFDGTVLCDAESRHNELFDTGRPEANCNAHPRRKVRDAEKAQPKLAKEAGAFFDQMYAVEREAKAQGLTGDALLELRQRRTRPVVDSFKAWLQAVEPDLLPSDPLGKAVRYYLRHFDALTRFVDDPRLPIDNNRSERGFQSHAKLRCNSLFAGSPEGAHRWATLLGIVETAKRHRIDVLAYLIWALERRGTWKARFGLTAAQLTPAAYKQALQQELAQTAAA